MQTLDVLQERVGGYAYHAGLDPRTVWATRFGDLEAMSVAGKQASGEPHTRKMTATEELVVDDLDRIRDRL